jgi:hypothetical protein
MHPVFKFLIAAAIALLPPAVASAADFSVRRGISMDIWETWPAEALWGEPHVILPYPQWQRRIGADELEGLKSAGFDFLRIPVDPAPFLSPRTAGLREALYRSVLKAVRLVNAAGLKAIVDLHLIPAGDDEDRGAFGVARHPGQFETYLGIVGRMAGILSSEPTGSVALELMNEPVAGCDGAEARWEEMLRRLHGAARAAAPELTLVLSGGCWSDAESLAEIDPSSFADSRILWTFHSYRPFLLTHQGALWAGDFIRYVTGIPYPPHGDHAALRDEALSRAEERIRAEAPLARRSGMIAYLGEEIAAIDTREELAAEMAEPFETVARWAARHSVRPSDILLGEFGMIRQEYGQAEIMRPEWRAAYAADMIALAEERGFAWAIWGYGGAFGVVEAFGGKPAEAAVLDVVRGLP